MFAFRNPLGLRSVQSLAILQHWWIEFERTQGTRIRCWDQNHLGTIAFRSKWWVHHTAVGRTVFTKTRAHRCHFLATCGSQRAHNTIKSGVLFTFPWKTASPRVVNERLTMFAAFLTDVTSGTHWHVYCVFSGRGYALRWAGGWWANAPVGFRMHSSEKMAQCINYVGNKCGGGVFVGNVILELCVLCRRRFAINHGRGLCSFRKYPEISAFVEKAQWKGVYVQCNSWE